MKNRRSAKAWSKHNLPLDLWREILSRLPVKSLLRFRCVSKSWRLMIDDPDFSCLHLSCFKNNRHETHLLVIQGRQRHSVVRCSNTFKSSKTLWTLGQWHCRGRWDVMCSFDGLVLLKNSYFLTPYELMLWNPSIRKFRCLPPFPEMSHDMTISEIGLGYDPLIKDYKYVRLVLPSPNQSLTVYSIAVYAVGTGSWKMIPFQGKGCSNWCWCHLSLEGRKTLCFRNGLYFLARNRKSEALELVSFDLNNEVFSFTSLPEDSDPKSHDKWKDLKFVDGGSSLALIDHYSPYIHIWVLEISETNAEGMYWTKRCSFSPIMMDWLYFKKNGDVLFGFLKEVRSYNIETHKEKVLLKNGRSLMMHEAWEYKESLILLKDQALCI